MDSNNTNLSIFLDETYFERIKDSKDPAKIRLKIIEYLLQCGSVSETARRFNVSRKTIRKWEKRYSEEGIEGLKDKSRAPKTSPRSISQEVQKIIINIKIRHPDYGIRKIKSILEEQYNINISIHPIYSTLKSAGFIKVGNHVR